MGDAPVGSERRTISLLCIFGCLVRHSDTLPVQAASPSGDAPSPNGDFSYYTFTRNARLHTLMKIRPLSVSLKSKIHVAFLLGAFCFCTIAAAAKEFSLPSKGSVIASISIPENWKSETVEQGVLAQSEDAKISVSVGALTALKELKELEVYGETTIQKYVKERGLKIDESSQREGSVKVDGLDTMTLTLKATGKDGPSTIMLFTVPMLKAKPVVIVFWWSDKEFSTHSEELDKIMDSLKGNSYTLDFSGTKKTQKPTEADLRQAVAALYPKKNDAFLVLSTSDTNYIQASVDSMGGFVVEYQEGDIKHHYQAKRSDLKADEVVKVLVFYVNGNDEWKKTTEWMLMEL